jgi:hypothetical protein
MQITGMLYGARLLEHVEFPASEILGPGATEDEIQGLIDRHKLIFIKPLFRGGIGKKGKAGLIGKATDLKTALKEKERLYFVEHRHGNAVAKSNGVTFESGVPAEHEVYFAITDATEFRAPTMTLTHRGGVDIEELDKKEVAQVPFEALTGLKAPFYYPTIIAPRFSPLVAADPDPTKGRPSPAPARGLFRRCDLFDWRLFGFGLFAMFISGVQEPIDQPGPALLHDPRVLGLFLVVEDFVIFCVAHGILHLRSGLTVKQLRNTVYSSGLFPDWPFRAHPRHPVSAIA